MTNIAMENHHAIKNGKPSISIRAIDKPWLCHNQRVYHVEILIWGPWGPWGPFQTWLSGFLASAKTLLAKSSNPLPRCRKRSTWDGSLFDINMIYPYSIHILSTFHVYQCGILSWVSFRYLTSKKKPMGWMRWIPSDGKLPELLCRKAALNAIKIRPCLQ